MKYKKPSKNYIINFYHNASGLPFSICRKVLKQENWNMLLALIRLRAIYDGKEKIT